MNIREILGSIVMEKSVYCVNEHYPRELGYDREECMSDEAVTLYYDFGCRGEFDSNQEWDSRCNYANYELGVIMDLMTDLGYELIFENDCSGNGLKYGSMIFDLTA